MLTEKEYKALAVLSARLAESVLMDWNKEEQVRLAKEVATKCHSIFNDKESREFVSLVKMMRYASHKYSALSREFCSKGMKPRQSQEWQDARKLTKQLESEVDEYLKKMEE